MPLKYKFIFIHIPRCAGMSVRKALGEMPVGKKNIMGDMGTAITLKAFVGKKIWNDSFKFCFVRNPWDRAVSMWKYINLKRNRWQQLSFSEFLEQPKDLNPAERWHSTTQLFHITDENGNIMADFIGRFENLQEDVNRVCEKCGIKKSQLPHMNKTEHKHYTKYYDDKTREIVAKKFKGDIECFGYKFEE